MSEKSVCALAGKDIQCACAHPARFSPGQEGQPTAPLFQFFYSPCGPKQKGGETEIRMLLFLLAKRLREGGSLKWWEGALKTNVGRVTNNWAMGKHATIPDIVQWFSLKQIILQSLLLWLPSSSLLPSSMPPHWPCLHSLTHNPILQWKIAQWTLQCPGRDRDKHRDQHYNKKQFSQGTNHSQGE